MGGLTGVSWALLVVHSIWSCALGLDMHKFWRMRKNMKIFARWPALALLSGCAGGAVQACIVLQEVLAQEGHVLPCVVVLYMNPVVIGPYAFSYLLRGLRAVIISDKAWRMKYMALFSRNSIAIFFTALAVMLLGICAMLQQVASDVYGVNPTEVCVFLGDWWFWCPSCFLMILAGSKLFIELSRLNDSINMAKEISTTAGVWVVLAVPYFSVIVLNAFNVLEMPRQHSFILWLCIALTLACTFMIEPRRHHGEVSCWKKKKKKQRVFVDDANVAAWKESWHNSEAIMSHPILDRAFEMHVQDHLCLESYDFVKEVAQYVTDAEKEPDEQLFVQFRRIVDVYILAGSELEINIESAMRKKVLEIGDREAFMRAATERRRDVFNPPKAEVLKILDDNLLQPFLASRQFLDASKKWQETLAADASISSASNTLGRIDNRDAFNEMPQAYTSLQEIYRTEQSGRRTNLGERGPSKFTRTSVTGAIKRWTSQLSPHSRTGVFSLTESFRSTVVSERSLPENPYE
ncbi:unnamed protein product [Ectocarpus fasciculatus]